MCSSYAVEGGDLIKTFKANMEELADPARSVLLKNDPDKNKQNRSIKRNFDQWRKAVSECMGDVTEHKRLVLEAKNLANTVKELEKAASEQEHDLTSLKADKADLQATVNDLRQLSDASKRWVEDAIRISRKKGQINRKNDDLSMSMTALSTGGNRNLRTVERELDEKREEKDTLMGRIARLNKEMTQINTRVANLSQQVRFYYH